MMKECDVLVVYTIFYPYGFKTKYHHFDNINVAEMFCSNKNIKDCSKIYVELDYLKKKDREIQIFNKIKDEMYKLCDIIQNMNFIDNRDCYAYKVAKEKLELLENIIRF